MAFPHTLTSLLLLLCLPFSPWINLSWITFSTLAGPAVGNNITCYNYPSFPHLRQAFIPLQQKSQPERFHLPHIPSCPLHQLHQQKYLSGCSVCTYSAAWSSCNVLAFRCWWAGRSGGVRTPQASTATKDNTTWNCGLIACQHTFH